jgi:hypothetical protein
MENDALGHPNQQVRHFEMSMKLAEQKTEMEEKFAEHLEKAVKSFQSQFDSFRDESTTKTELKEAKLTTSQVQAEVDTLRADLRTAQRTIKQLETAVAGKPSKVEITDVLATHKVDHDKLAARVKVVEHNYITDADMEVAIDNKYHTRLETLEERLMRCEGASDSIGARMTTHDGNILTVNTRIENCEAIGARIEAYEDMEPRLAACEAARLVSCAGLVPRLEACELTAAKALDATHIANMLSPRYLKVVFTGMFKKICSWFRNPTAPSLPTRQEAVVQVNNAWTVLVNLAICDRIMSDVGVFLTAALELSHNVDQENVNPGNGTQLVQQDNVLLKAVSGFELTVAIVHFLVVVTVYATVQKS